MSLPTPPVLLTCPACRGQHRPHTNRFGCQYDPDIPEITALLHYVRRCHQSLFPEPSVPGPVGVQSAARPAAALSSQAPDRLHLLPLLRPVVPPLSRFDQAIRWHRWIRRQDWHTVFGEFHHVLHFVRARLLEHPPRPGDMSGYHDVTVTFAHILEQWSRWSSLDDLAPFDATSDLLRRLLYSYPGGVYRPPGWCSTLLMFADLFSRIRFIFICSTVQHHHDRQRRLSLLKITVPLYVEIVSSVAYLRRFRKLHSAWSSCIGNCWPDLLLALRSKEVLYTISSPWTTLVYGGSALDGLERYCEHERRAVQEVPSAQLAVYMTVRGRATHAAIIMWKWSRYWWIPFACRYPGSPYSLFQLENTMNTAYGWPLNGTHSNLMVLLARRRLTWGLDTKTTARPRPSGSACRAMIRSLGSSLGTPSPSSSSRHRTLKRGHVLAYRQARRELLRIIDLGLEVQEPKRRERTSTQPDLPILSDDAASSDESASDDLYSDPDESPPSHTPAAASFRSFLPPPPPLSHTSGGLR